MADKGEEAGSCDGFKDHYDEECEDVEDDQAKEPLRRVLRRARSTGRGGASNKYTFCKVSQIVFSQAFTCAKRMYFCKLSQTCFRRNT